ncbi:MAG: hypothetical protein DME22_22475, partial [Verrucomicrobia bacterium]
IYHNRLLESRLSAYPAFLSLAERQEFQDIANDTEYQNMLATQAPVSQVINHPKTQAILSNQEIIQQLQQTDLKDLFEYLKTGESPKFADMKILGRWQLDPYATLLQEKKKRSRLTTVEMKLLKQQLEFVKGYTLVVTPDNNVKLKGPDVVALMQKYIGDLKAFAEGTARKPVPTVRATAPAPAQPITPNVSPQMAQRYGLNRAAPAPARAPAPPPVAVSPAAPAAAPPSPVAIAAEIAKLPIVVLAQGNWKGEGDSYELTMQSQAGGFQFGNGKKSATVEATIRDGRLYLTEENETMVMEKF